MSLWQFVILSLFIFACILFTYINSKSHEVMRKNYTSLILHAIKVCKSHRELSSVTEDKVIESAEKMSLAISELDEHLIKLSKNIKN